MWCRTSGRRRLALARWTLPAIALAVGTACWGPCSVSEGHERELGAYQAAYIDSAAQMISDTAITRYVATLGQSMTTRTSRAGLDWRYAEEYKREYGISDDFVKQVGGMIQPGQSAVFVLARTPRR